MRALALAGALLVAGPLQAQPLRVAVSLVECSEQDWSESELQRSLALELRSDGVMDLAARDPNVWLEVQCDPGRASVALQARSDARAPLTREMSLSDVPPELQARAIAIGLAELLRGTWFSAEPPPPTAAEEEQPQPTSEPQVDVAPKRATPPPATGESTTTLDLAPALRLYGPATTLVYGGRFSFHVFDLQLGAQAFLATRTDPLGSLHYGLASALAAYDLLHVRMGPVTLTGAPRAAIGFSWASADAIATVTEASAIDLVWELAGQLTLALPVDTTWSLALSLGAGYAHGPRYQADASVRASLGGGFGDAALGVSWRL